MKHLEENVREKLHNIGFDNDYLNMTPSTGNNNKKIDKLYFIKIKNCASKNTINRMKNLLTRMGKHIYKSCLIRD